MTGWAVRAVPELMEKIFIRRVLSPSVGRVCIAYLCAFQL